MAEFLPGAGRGARAVSFEGPRRVALVDVEVPPPGADEVLVRTLWSGISGGTEMLAYRGDIDPETSLDDALGSLGGTFTYPFRYGYSCVGRVERECGPLAAGQVVFAFHPHQDRFVVPVGEVVAVDGIDPRLATLLPLVETAAQVAADAGVVAGVAVVVAGMGAVGLLTAMLLQRAGAAVVASEPRAWRRTVAEEAGIDAVAPEELPEVVRGRTAGEGVPLVVEASGDPATLADVLGLLAHEGEALVASWYGAKPVSLPLGGAFHRRRLRIRSTQVSTIPRALAGRWTIERRRRLARQLLVELPLAKLATHEFPFDAAADAFAAVDRADRGLVHAALCYE